jgi:hypothetical protein
MAEKVIFVLAAITVVVLFLGMRSFLTAPDPTRLPTSTSIQAIITRSGARCDNVDSTQQLGSEDGWSYYLARCHDGGRYVYFQNPVQKQMGAMTCNEEQARGYFCPE